MSFDPTATSFYVLAHWPRRGEEPSALGARLGQFLDGLSQLHDTLARWKVGLRYRPYEDVRDRLASVVARDVNRADDGEALQITGYSIVATSADKRQYFGIVGCAGATYAAPMANRMDFHTSAGVEPDMSIVTYGLMKRAMLHLIACWEPSICFTRTNKLTPDWDNEGRFAKAWMTYVAPAYASSIDRSGIPIVDEIPDGGLLLSATAQIFRADNPMHLEAADRISRATRHLNDIVPVL